MEDFKLEYGYNELIDLHRMHVEFDVRFTDSNFKDIPLTVVLGNDIPDPLFRIVLEDGTVTLGTYRATNNRIRQAMRVACFMRPEILKGVLLNLINTQILGYYHSKVIPVETQAIAVDTHTCHRIPESMGIGLYAFEKDGQRSLLRYSQRDESVVAVDDNVLEITPETVKQAEAIFIARLTAAQEAGYAFYC
ncbi:hypothetical protein pEaSNUABM54_00142 [Erwinia phage pEa_SNUABM_54]|nr:hypothetical protein pEaSNUABM54_00142 [Erwinia phage pEa_SNUABM_54]